MHCRAADYAFLEPITGAGQQCRRDNSFLMELSAGFRLQILSLMKEAIAKSWYVVSAKYQGFEATAQGRSRLARAVVAVNPTTATNAELARMAIDYLTLEERDAPDVLSGLHPGYAFRMWCLRT